MPAIERLTLDGQPEPVSHYCHVTKAGNFVWVSGTVGIGSDGSIPGDVVEQFELAIANMDACLKAVGAGAEHVVNPHFSPNQVHRGGDSERVVL
jgi:enamine deaminase RidA (YjgF/YER057c/UK114 family)